MPKDYPTDKIWELYKTLPEDLQEAIFSPHVAKNIWDICEKNEVGNSSQIAKLIGDVLLGLLPPEELADELKEEAGLSSLKAKKVAREANRFIFYSFKNSLNILYERDLSLEKPKEKEERKEESEDKYREAIEE